MSYYDDYDDDEEYSSDEDVYYHNYSVDYANQILAGHHAISSCLPRMRRKQRRHIPRLVRVSTLDQMPITSMQQMLPSIHSRPKYGNDELTTFPNISFASPSLPPPPPLPSLAATSEELERRATGRTQPISQPSSNLSSISTNNINSSPENTQRPMTEAELRHVQQQQEAFQQHLLNMQRHLLEQSQQQQQQETEQQVPASPSPTPPPPPPSSSTVQRFEKRSKVSYHDIQRDDDQNQIAQLIETDPYFAAAMEDFAQSHGLVHHHRHRKHSDYSSSQYSQPLCKRHRAQYCGNHSHRHASSSSSSSSSISTLTDVTPQTKNTNTELILLRELQGIRLIMEEYVRNRNNNPQMMPGPWSMPMGYYPPGTDYQSSNNPRQQIRPPDPGRVAYQTVINAVKDVLDQRPVSEREQPLKPSQIDPRLKHVYTKRPQIPPSNRQPTLLPTPSHQQQQLQNRRRSSQRSTPPILSPSQQQRRRSSQLSTPPPPPPPPSNIPPAPPYEALATFSSRSTTNKNRNLSYGSQQRKQSDIYDTLRPGHYLRLFNN